MTSPTDHITWSSDAPRPTSTDQGGHETTVYLKLPETDPVLADSKTLRAHMDTLLAEAAAARDLSPTGFSKVVVCHPSNMSFEILRDGYVLVAATAMTTATSKGDGSR